MNDSLFNVEILIPNEKQISTLGEVKTGAIFEPSSSIFNKDGLFSTSIFGPIGSAMRNKRCGYIDLKLPIIHPLVYKQIVKLSSFYSKIINSEAYAVFDNSKKDFVLSTREGGETGFNFFLKHITKVNFDTRNSLARESRVNVAREYLKPDKLLRYLIVLPAGLRDYTVNKQGQPSEDEINNLYRKVLMTSNIVSNTSMSDENLKYLDPTRLKIQKNVVEIYDYILNLLGTNGGKNKFIQGKWAKRGTVYGTRNVITPSPINVQDLDAENKVGVNDTVIGLYQFLKGIFPAVPYFVQKEFINNLIDPSNPQVLAVNPKTMKSEFISIKQKDLDTWLTSDGIETTVNKMIQPVNREEPVLISDHYMMLVYDTGDTIECIRSTDDIDDSYDKTKLRPLTYGELFYISIYDVRTKYPGLFTRYPITGEGSIYPSDTYVKTTYVSRTITLKKDGISKVMYEYIKPGEEWVESLSCSPIHLGRLGGDFDGDKCSYVLLFTDESIAEAKKVMNSKAFYLSNGSLTYSSGFNTSDLVVQHMTMQGV